MIYVFKRQIGAKEMVQSIGYSSRRPRFISLPPYGGSQLAVTLVPVGDLTPAKFQ